jgi:hypothetical protein
MIALAQGLVSWLGVFVAVGGAVLTALHLGRSRWVLVLTGGFAVEAAVLAFYRVGVMFMRNSIFGPRMLSLAFLAAGVVGLLARAAVVAGVFGIVSELPRSTTTGPAAQPPAA